MATSLLSRLVLVATLVFSQALYAGHAVLHDTGSQPDCQICLQASAGTAASPGDTQHIVAVYRPQQIPAHGLAPETSQVPNAHPSRAPPILLP